MKRYLVALCFPVVLSACAVCGHADDEYYKLATALTKLSAAVEYAVRYEHPPEGLSDRELIDFSVRHDPSLAMDFEDYLMKVSVNDDHAILLVCRDDSVAILEDLGCTAKLDAQRWENHESCEFTLSTAQCP